MSQCGALQVIALDDLLAAPAGVERPHHPDTSNRRGTSGSTCAAFVMFTSGSTGTPKGVLLEHAGIANMALHCSHALGCGPQDVHLRASTVSFDAMFLEILVPLVLAAA